MDQSFPNIRKLQDLYLSFYADQFPEFSGLLSEFDCILNPGKSCPWSPDIMKFRREALMEGKRIGFEEGLKIGRAEVLIEIAEYIGSIA